MTLRLYNVTYAHKQLNALTRNELASLCVNIKTHFGVHFLQLT